MFPALRVLMLLTDGFGGIGGIAKFNRDFLQALDNCSLVERVQALPRLILGPIKNGTIPETVVYDRHAAGGKTAFIRRVAAHIFQSNRVNLIICAHINLLAIAWLVGRLRGARLVLVIYGIDAWEPSSRPWILRLIHTVDAFISISRISADRFSRWSGVPIERFFILPPCVDLDQFQPGQRDIALVNKYGLQSSRVILTLGRLEPRERYKGFDEVIDVMPVLIKGFPDLKYLIVGDGPDRARLEAKVAALGMATNVIFTGYIPESEKVAHYSLADAFVMPSTGEGFGIVLIEAAACGVPVVGSHVDGSREALLDGQLGSLVDPERPDELVQAVATILEGAPTRRRSDRIDVFSVHNFRARVANWCRAQLVHEVA
jgi:glycosyltransferase involved in cell wall biosynthesis